MTQQQLQMLHYLQQNQNNLNQQEMLLLQELSKQYLLMQRCQQSLLLQKAQKSSEDTITDKIHMGEGGEIEKLIPPLTSSPCVPVIASATTITVTSTQQQQSSTTLPSTTMTTIIPPPANSKCKNKLFNQFYSSEEQQGTRQQDPSIATSALSSEHSFTNKNICEIDISRSQQQAHLPKNYNESNDELGKFFN